MSYVSTFLRTDICIEQIVSIHYFEYMSNFSFEGESHDFWEFCYMDKGEVEVTADGVPHTLRKGEIIFHKPNEFHELKANGRIAPNLVVMAFHCSSPCMDFFRDKILTLTAVEQNLLAEIITEARKCFSSPLDNPYLQQLERRTPSPFASEQLIRLYLEQFFLLMYRRCQEHQPAPPACEICQESERFTDLYTDSVLPGRTCRRAPFDRRYLSCKSRRFFPASEAFP